jgi:hypothetical protein
MRKHIINVSGYILLAIASMIGVIANLLTLINFDSEIHSIWIKWQAIVFVAVLGILFILAVYFIVVWLIRLIQDIKINRE